MKEEKATFAAGCFWGVEETFRQLDGITATSVGYTGGTIDNPTYEMVCSDTTGHAEAIEITFDPEKISYEKLLGIFFDNHNPTTRDRQGPDMGSQYRSAIFYHLDEQKKLAEDYVQELDASKRWEKPVVTQIAPATTFWKAEDYHQQYLKKRGLESCHY